MMSPLWGFGNSITIDSYNNFTLPGFQLGIKYSITPKEFHDYRI